MYALAINQLTLAYGERQIITQFNAQIAAGEFIGLFGPNGAGKSTLLRAILGLVTSKQGTIQVFGQPTGRHNPAIGYMAQNRFITPTSQLSGRAHISVAQQGVKWGLPLQNKTQRAEIEKVLTLVAAQDYAERPYYQLSGGERQRLLLAQALLGNPKLLLLDEPLANLDPRHQESLIELIQKIRTELNITILFAAHDLNPLLSVMDRVIYLARGKAAIGTVEEIVNDAKLSWLYGTPIEVIKHHHRLFVISQDKGVIAGDAAHDHPHADHF